MSDDKLPPLDKVIAALKIGHKYLGPDTVDLAAAAWLERQQAEIERLRAEIERLNKGPTIKKQRTRQPFKIEEC